MESLIRFFLHQWQRKLVALVTATTIWIFVNHSITATKTIPSVPVRVVNLPVDKTIPGLLPNGFLGKRTTLTLTGTKDVVEQLEPGDLEVLIDVSNQPNEGLIQFTKKNLVSLNPNINLLNHITSINHPEFGIKMSAMLTEKIPVTIHPPTGAPPENYEFLDIWPIKLTQTVSGPQEQVLSLKEKGLELTFNLNEISKEQLDSLAPSQNAPHDDEISFFVPEQWKKIVIPSLNTVPELLNDPEAKNLQINFLRKQYLPIKVEVPIEVFYPLKHSDTINPETYPIISNTFVQQENFIPVLKVPLFTNNVSRLFLDIVQENIQINIIAAPRSERETLAWDVGFIDETHLEDTYVAFLLSTTKGSSSHTTKTLDREKYFRQRFRYYMQKFALYLPNKQPLALESILETDHISVSVPDMRSLPSKLKTSNNAR